MEERSLSERIFFTEKQWLHVASTHFTKVLRAQVFAQNPAHRYSFSPDLPLKQNVEKLYLLGYWHTYVMVNEVAHELRTELTLKKPAQGKNLELLAQISRNQNSVSIHVRRGDCMIPATGRAELPFEYYANAISRLRKRLVDPTFFIFSDDIRSVKEYLPRNIRAVFVDHNDDFSAHEDMRLMSSCRHHIIANSTFSWWGAWLNPRSDKVVIAPRQWDVTEKSFYPDLLPPSWTLTDVVFPDIPCRDPKPDEMRDLFVNELSIPARA